MRPSNEQGCYARGSPRCTAARAGLEAYSHFPRDRAARQPALRRRRSRFLTVRSNGVDELERSGTKTFTRHIEASQSHAGRPRSPRDGGADGGGVFRSAREGTHAPFSGEVKLATTEAFGTFWLAPRLVELQRTHPKLLVDLNCEMRSADVLRLEAHASVQLSEPTAPDVKVVRLGRIHSMPAAAPSYIEMYGVPKSVDDLRNHRLALQFAEQTGTQELYERVFPGVPQLGLVAFRTNNSSALLWAIIKGADRLVADLHACDGPQMVLTT